MLVGPARAFLRAMGLDHWPRLEEDALREGMPFMLLEECCLRGEPGRVPSGRESAAGVDACLDLRS